MIETLPTRKIESNGLTMAVHDVGEGPPVVLLHGFPELAFSWRAQIPALAAAGWRAIAPDLRGYGDTGPKGDLEAYSMRNLSRDVLGLLDALGLEHAVVVGHDFGGMLAWSLARDHAERIVAVASLNTPYTRRGSADLAATLLRVRGPTNYMVVAQTPGVAEAILEEDVAATFRGLMRGARMTPEEIQADPRLRPLPLSLLAGREPTAVGEPVMPEAELEVYIDAFRRNGFTAPLNWYRNLHRNWLDTGGSSDRVDVPALMVCASHDLFLPPSAAEGMEAQVPDLERRLIEDCGHWTQHERPEAVNAILLDWLERRARPLF